jgi:hypothetical protein
MKEAEEEDSSGEPCNRPVHGVRKDLSAGLAGFGLGCLRFNRLCVHGAALLAWSADGRSLVELPWFGFRRVD